MGVKICRQFSFDAAHRLPMHNGKCNNLHGHHYVLQISVCDTLDIPPFTSKKDKPQSSTGMVMDFGDMKALVNREVIDKLDHTLLNDIWVNPTAEKMVYDIALWLKPLFLQEGVVLMSVRLYETPDSYAEWSA